MIFLLQKTLIFATPLLLVALAGMYAERSGIINIALEGFMVFGSFFGAIFVYNIQKNIGIQNNQITYLIAMLVAAISGAVFSLLLSFSAINLKAEQTIGGTAINMLAPAVALFFIKVIFMQDKLVMPKDIGFVILNPELPDVLRIFFDKAYISTFIALIIFIILSFIMWKTRFGLRLRACGEHPQAAASVGINVNKMRYIGVMISGALGALGGYIYIATVAGGTCDGSVAGTGFLALAIMIFGNWKPGGIFIGAIIFGLLKCLASVYTMLDLNGDGKFLLKDIGLPMYFYNLIPYVVVLIVLILTSKKSRAPKAEGIPYDKGAR